jgi:hypothetical protein
MGEVKERNLLFEPIYSLMTFRKNCKKFWQAERLKFLLFDPDLSGEFKNFSEVRH